MKNVYCLKIEDSYYDEYPHAMELIDARFWGKREALLALLEACLKDLPLKVDTEDHANIAIRSVTRQMSVRSGEVKDEMPLRVSRKRRTASKVKQSSSETRKTSPGTSRNSPRQRHPNRHQAGCPIRNPRQRKRRQSLTRTFQHRTSHRANPDMTQRRIHGEQKISWYWMMKSKGDLCDWGNGHFFGCVLSLSPAHSATQSSYGVCNYKRAD